MKRLWSRIAFLFRSYDLYHAIALAGAYFIVLLHNRSGAWKMQERMLGFRISFPGRHAFFSQFVELFLEHVYALSRPGRPDLRILDCGSNIGMSVLYFKWMYPLARITCFEPNPEACTYLERNIAQNKLADVSVHQAAVSGTAGTLLLQTESVTKASPGASLFRTKYAGEAPPIEVPVVTLSSFVTEPIDLLKLDVEGAEGAVIEELAQSGALARISEYWIEYHFDAVPAPYSLEGIMETLTGAGFTVRRVDSHASPAMACILHAVKD